MSKWKRYGHIWAGALGALFVGWSAIVFGGWLTSMAWTALHPPPSLLPPLKYIAGFGLLWMIAFIPIGFAMGFICAFFWRNIAELDQPRSWVIGLCLIFFMPLSVFGIGFICVLLFLFPLFSIGFSIGLKSHARLPHFLGLANDWERDKTED